MELNFIRCLKTQPNPFLFTEEGLSLNVKIWISKFDSALLKLYRWKSLNIRPGRKENSSSYPTNTVEINFHDPFYSESYSLKPLSNKMIQCQNILQINPTRWFNLNLYQTLLREKDNKFPMGVRRVRLVPYQRRKQKTISSTCSFRAARKMHAQAILSGGKRTKTSDRKLSFI